MKDGGRIWVLGSAGAAVLLLAGGWFLGVQPQLAAAETSTASADQTAAQTQAVQLRVAMLSKAAANLTELEMTARALRKSVPPKLQANTFIRRVNTLAALHGVTVQSVTVGSAEAYASPPSLDDPIPVDPAAASAEGDVAAASIAPVATSPRLALKDPAVNGENFTVVPMSVVVQGAPEAGRLFTRAIQNDERLYLVSGFFSSVDQEDITHTTTTLTGSVYVLKR